MRAMRMALAVVLAMTVTGCGFVGASDDRGSEKRKVSKVSLQEAAERADGIMLATMASVRPEVNWVHYGNTDGGVTRTRSTARRPARLPGGWW